MDFSQRTGRPNNDQVAASGSKSKSKKGIFNNLKLFSVVLLYSLTVLIVALAVYAFIIGGRDNSQNRFIAKSNYQAVFLNGGQVYFGKITSANSKYMTLNDIYYLRVNQQVQPGQQASSNDVSLVKLGCELHGPHDQMVINQDQVVFWENLKADGQVAKAIKQFQEQNPDGLKCETAQTNNTNTNNTTSNTNTNNTNTNNQRR
jgi:hypothetical protein